MIWATALLAAFGAVVMAITLTPEPVDAGLRPTIARLLATLHTAGVPAWFDYTALEFSANVALFVPLAFLTAMLLPPRRWWMTLPLGAALSILIELTQAAFLAARYATVSDVVANSAGAAIGGCLALVVRNLARRGRRA